MTARRKVMAVDPGAKRVGLALSDDNAKVAFPLEVVPTESSLERIAELVSKHEVTELIVGLPRTLRGGESEAAAEARRFARSLEETLDVTVNLIDERLTTIAAERSMQEAKVTSRRARGVVDKIAATLLLQSFLDSQNSPNRTGDTR